MTDRVREIMRQCVDNSAGCICIEYPDGKCPCSQEVIKAETAIREAIADSLEGMKKTISRVYVTSREEYLNTMCDEEYNSAITDAQAKIREGGERNERIV